MSKKIFFKLGVLLLSLSLVACGQKNNSEGENASSISNTSQSVSTAQNLGEESIKTPSSTVENVEEGKQEDEDVQQDTQSDIEQATQEKATEDEFYTIIKEAWQKQNDYIESIDDPKVKHSVQTSQSAAIMEATRLLIEHPEDAEAIDASIKRVLNGD